MAVLDFANGIIASDAPDSDTQLGIIDHAGLRAPQFEVPSQEYGVLDGAMLGNARAMGRRMTVKMSRGSVPMSEIERAFAPKGMRTLTAMADDGSARSIPYVVDALELPARNYDRHFTVSLVSPWAYPRGPRVTFGGTTADDTVTTVNTTVGTSDPGVTTPTALVRDTSFPNLNGWGQAISLANNASLTHFSLYFTRPPGSSPGTFRPTVLRQNGGSYETVFLGDVRSLPEWSVLSGNRRTASTLSYTNTSGSAETLIIAGINMSTDCQAPLATAGGARRLIPGTGWTSFTADGNDAFRIVYTVSTPSSTSTVCPVVYTGDVPAPARVVVKPANTFTSLILTATDTSGGLVSDTRMTGSVPAESIVTFGDDEAERSLLVGSTNRLSWFDMTRDWPLVTPQTAAFESSALGNIEVSFEPRYMGLI